MAYSDKYKHILGRMGYYDYQLGLIHRHINQEGGWDSHLEHCRNFILKAVKYYNPSKITILGSGWLLDLPLAEMSEMAQEIVLIDIVHPPEVRAQAGSLKNVKILEDDVTGGLIEEVWKKTRRKFFFIKPGSFDSINIPDYCPDEDPGLVISLNILSQLETLIIEHLKQQVAVSEEDLSGFRKEIQDKHIKFLAKNNSVLITDIAEIFKENSGKTTRHNSVVTELPDGKVREEWSWNFDLKGSDYNNKKSYFEVVALIL
jgi:hypothetical protein